MKNPRIFLLLVSLAVCNIMFSQQSIVFEKTYRTETSDTVIMALTGAQTSDGGYLLGGYAAYGMYLAQMMFFKIDSVGNYQWKKMYGSLPCSSNMIHDMEPVGDGTFICCGEGTFSTEGAPSDLKPTNSMIMRVDENANILWFKEFDAGYHECLYELALSDTGYICVGYKRDMTKDPGHYLWVTGDKDGNFSKLSTLDMGLGWQSLSGVSKSIDNVFVASGSCDNRSCILTISYNGDTLRTTVLGRGFPEQYSINSITGINMNKFVFGGLYIEAHPSDSTNAFLASINSNTADTIFMVLPSENNYKQNNLKKILYNNQWSFLSLGMLQTYDRGSEIWLRKYDENFDLLWKRYIGGESGETLRDVIKTSDDGYLIIGESSSFNIYTSMYIVKTDSLGLGNYTSPVVEYKIPVMNFAVYPNPADSYFIIKNTNNKSSGIFVFDISGKIVIQSQITDSKTIINTEYLPSGIYIVKSVSEDNVNTSKIIINH